MRREPVDEHDRVSDSPGLVADADAVGVEILIFGVSGRHRRDDLERQDQEQADNDAKGRCV